MDWTHDWTSQRDRGRVYGSSDGTWAVLALDLGGLLVKQSIGANTGPDGQEGACLNRVSVAETGRLLFGHPRTLSRVFIGHTTAGRALLKPHSWPGSLGTMRKVVSGCIPLSANRRSTSALERGTLATETRAAGGDQVPPALAAAARHCTAEQIQKS
eukprot:CAMPEP_0114174058 /NCGR_PEP_ID=MMETSP0043_2-20121206/36181_1 /TAXON_ID=464988 /ORGANISM="Hemiselmis andersenii, Strain CCMP644" /LENGTH=156 /DNA_ID=CAMNT_0001272125 /DNA_START=160 /DNA_END=629 /DNA_ORIENTATION=+